MKEFLDINLYGLDRPDALEVAIQLAPELFAALAMSKRLSNVQFPISSEAEMERAVELATSGRLGFPGVEVTPEDAKERFPKEFLPVLDWADLVGKIYLAIVINHKADARESKKRLIATELQSRISHPLPVEEE